ncbi:MAG: zinc-dependent peptidase [Rhizobacter sp.]|nr:zinc-dependent peptidase [Rhizobacter sp.]
MLAAWRRWRDRRTLLRRAIPDALWQSTLRHFPFLDRLSPDDAIRLRELATLFLARKEFSGAQGLEVTDDMAVAIAAQACLPILKLGLDWYDGFVGIVVHAGEVLARREVMDEDGVVHHYDEPLSGEAMEGGPVTLSWQDVAHAGTSADWGYNVVIHEFAHVLDMRDGMADGIPPLPDRAMHLEWRQVLGSCYERFCQQVERGIDTALDPYGAEAPSEFFAVSCEAFFVAPLDLLDEQPALYALLSRFFQQDPASRA